jgi:hypothetical protein
MTRKPGMKVHSTNILDYASNLSMIDKEALVAKAKLKTELNLKHALAVSCPTCGAAPGDRCELSTAQPRTNPHRDRRLIAKDRGNGN